MSSRRSPGDALVGPRHHRATTVALLGRLVVAVDGRELAGFDGRRVQELLAFLVVNHDRPLPREAVADRLWRDGGSERRKQLRHTLWQLQHALTAVSSEPILDVDSEWLCLVPPKTMGIDVLRIELAQRKAHGLSGSHLPVRTAEELRQAVALYAGDLLPSCYEDWCLIERERYRAMYLELLDKLIVHAEASGRFEDGLEYGELVLRQDRASERTHRRLMKLRCLMGDRTGALRQLDRCVRALQEELDVKPGPGTLALAEMIRQGLPLDAPDGREHARVQLRALQTSLMDASAFAADALAALDADQ